MYLHTFIDYTCYSNTLIKTYKLGENQNLTVMCRKYDILRYWSWAAEPNFESRAHGFWSIIRKSTSPKVRIRRSTSICSFYTPLSRLNEVIPSRQMGCFYFFETNEARYYKTGNVLFSWGCDDQWYKRLKRTLSVLWLKRTRDYCYYMYVLFFASILHWHCTASTVLNLFTVIVPCIRCMNIAMLWIVFHFIGFAEALEDFAVIKRMLLVYLQVGLDIH